MNALAAAALAAGELVCEFSDGHRRSLIAGLAGDPPRTEQILVYGPLAADSTQVLASSRAGRRPVAVRADEEHVHLIEADGASVRVTTLTGCLRTRLRGDAEVCTRFEARHAWHFDNAAHLDAAASFRRQPSGGATGWCEPWRLD